VAEHTVTASSALDSPAEVVWAHSTSFEGVNYELMPIMRMTAPRDVRERGLAGVEVGQRICRSWVLLFGLIPFDYDDVTLARLDPGRGFLERSPMGSQRLWEHERTIEPTEAGCTLTDRLRFEPKLAAAGGFVEWLIRRTFAHRHRRLRKRFGGRTLEA
jgi:ligand-binding SRPBCC domain-containing protein